MITLLNVCMALGRRNLYQNDNTDNNENGAIVIDNNYNGIMINDDYNDNVNVNNNNNKIGDDYAFQNIF